MSTARLTRVRWLPIVVILSFLLGACTVLPKGQADLDVGIKERGIASWYGDDFNGRLTASGEAYDMHAWTGAHRTLPLGTVVKVTNAANGKQVQVRINDRGPYANGRILDLSYAAAQELEMIGSGTSAVQLEVIGHQPSEFRLGVDRLLAGLSGLAQTGQEPTPAEAWAITVKNQRLTPTETRTGRTIHRYPVDLIFARRGSRKAYRPGADQRLSLEATLLS